MATRPFWPKVYIANVATNQSFCRVAPCAEHVASNVHIFGVQHHLHAWFAPDLHVGFSFCFAIESSVISCGRKASLFWSQQIRLSVHLLHLTSDSNRDTFRLAFSCLLQEGKRAQNLNS